MKRIKILVAILATVIAWCSVAHADVILVPDFRVDQGSSVKSVGGVASSLTYNYFVVLYRSATPSPSEGDCWARRFDLNGNSLGDAFRVDSAPESATTGCTDVIIDPDGNMIFSFSYNGDIYSRKFDINENPLTPDTFLLSATGGNIALMPDGGFVLIHETGGIFARIYDSSGSLVKEFQADQSGTDNGLPRVSTSSTGQICIAWTFGSPGTAIYARLFDSSGNPLGNEFRVDQSTNGVDSRTIATAPNGNFIVGWDDYREEGDFGMSDVFARAFDSTGTALGNDFKVNSETSGENAGMPRISFAPSGRALMTWNDSRGTVNHYGRHLDSNGNILDDDFELHSGVNSGYTDNAPAGVNSFISVWGDERSGNYEVWANITGPGGVVPMISTPVMIFLVLVFFLLVIRFSRKRAWSHLVLVFIFIFLALSGC